MSSRAVTTIVCDQCAAEQREETFATETIVLKFGADPSRQIDLCDEHAEAATVLRAVVRTRGAAVPDQKKLRAGVVTCEICGQECKGGTGLAAHTRARHE